MLLANSCNGLNVLMTILATMYATVVLCFFLFAQKKTPKVGKPVRRQVPRDRIEQDLPPWDGSVKAEPRK